MDFYIKRLESINIDYCNNYSVIESELNRYHSGSVDRVHVLYRIRLALFTVMNHYRKYLSSIVTTIRSCIPSMHILVSGNPSRWMPTINSLEVFTNHIEDYIGADNHITSDCYKELCKNYNDLIMTVSSNYSTLSNLIIELNWLDV